MKVTPRALLALCVSLWLATPLAAQTSGPIRILVGFGPGSTADTLARLVGRHMEQTFSQAVVVENRPGNSSMIAAETVARAVPDGLTLFMGTIAQTLNPVQTRSGFDLGKQMTPVALLGVVPNMLVTHPDVAAKNLTELIALARAKPESLTFGTSGSGTASHLAAEMFNQKAGTRIVTVHYQGGSNQALADLLAGRITLMFNVAATLAPHVRSDKLRALAIAQPRRAGVMPELPTMDEAGMPGFDVGIWIGLLAPAGTPPQIVDKLSRVANEALKTEPVMKAMSGQGIDPIGSTPKEFADFIDADIAKWTALFAAMPKN